MGTENSNGNIEFNIGDTSTSEQSNAFENRITPKKGRGRPPKNANKEINFEKTSRLLIETPKNSARKDNRDEKALETNIQIMITTLFSVLASKNPIWIMTDEETKAIAEPAARIIRTLIPANTASKYADYALLVGALTMTIAPRLIMMRGAKQVEKQTTQPITRVERRVEQPAKPERPENNGNSAVGASILRRIPSVG